MKAKKIAKRICETVRKSGGVSRGLIDEELRAGAALLAAEKGISREQAEMRIVRKGGDELLRLYGVSKALPAKQADRGTMHVTRAEAQLDSLARKMMKSNGLTYPEALGQALQTRPDLYAAYEREKAAG